MPDLTAGWGWPPLAKKAHYFKAGGVESICGRWWYTGPRDSEEKASKDDCVACTRILEKVVKS